MTEDGARRCYAESALANRQRGATFLCYHSVMSQGPRYLTVSPQMFERHLEELQRKKVRFGDLRALTEVAAGRSDTPTVFITFDDGFRDNYETVLPMLRDRGIPAFVFVLPPLLDEGAALAWPELVDEEHRYPGALRSVTWQMLEEMKGAGFEVGSHTLTHAHLPELEDDALREELLESRRALEARLGSCETLAYPFGEFDTRVATAAGECGYRFAFSLPTAHGQHFAGVHTIPRVNVDYRDGPVRFRIKLSPVGRRFLLSPSMRRVKRFLAG